MSFAQKVQFSTTEYKVLVEIDISAANTQWVNSGAGIWKVNFEGLYPEVDSSLLDGFTSLNFTNIGSVLANGLFLAKTSTLLEMTGQSNTYFYDSSLKTLYISLPNYDNPIFYNIEIGVVYGVSDSTFTPVNSYILYDGRLTKIPQIGYSRGPLFFGKISFPSTSIEVINADGYFDAFAKNNYIYGNAIRIYYGFDNLDYSEYLLAYSGFIETIEIGEETMQVSATDKRKQISKSITYSCTNKNACDAIVELLQIQYPSLTYNSIYFNTTEWDAATAIVDDITIVGDSDNPERIIDIIEKICASVFGVFLIEPDGRFSFKVIDASAAPNEWIQKNDVLNRYNIVYDPTEVLSSVKITYGTAPSVLIDTTSEEAIFLKYKTYNQHSVDTYLPTLTAASALASTIIDYSGDVHGRFTVDVPMKYYTLELGDTVAINVERDNAEILGFIKCEIMGKTYKFDSNLISFDLRTAGDLSYRVTTSGDYRVTTNYDYRIVEG